MEITKKAGAITESGVVIQNIQIRPVARPENADVERWRNAHKAAEAYVGIRTSLYDLYEDALLDTFLKQLVKRRILNVRKNKLRYVIDDVDVEGATELIRKKEFRKLRYAIQNAKAWGIAVIELINEGGNLKIFDVPKKHIRPDQGIITWEQNGADGIAYRDLATVVEIGEWNDLGYILEAVPCAFIKRGNIGDWANYAQMFGMPFREARYDGFNEQVRIQLETAMERAASAAYAVLPKEAELTFHEMQGTAGSNTLYDTLRKAMNEEMSVHVLGSTETITSSASSGYAQSETHKKTVDDIAQDDKADELSILNEKVLDVLVKIGLLPKGGQFVYDEPLDLDIVQKKVSIAQQMRIAGAPVSDDYLYEITGIPKPDDYDAQKDEVRRRQEQQLLQNDNRLSLKDTIKLTLDDFFAEALKGL